MILRSEEWPIAKNFKTSVEESDTSDDLIGFGWGVITFVNNLWRVLLPVERFLLQ